MKFFILLLPFLFVNQSKANLNEESVFLKVINDTKLESGDQIHQKGNSLVFCLAHCHFQEQCHSVNYHTEQRHCIVNRDVDGEEKESLFVASVGWMYYEKSLLKLKKIIETNSVSATTQTTSTITPTTIQSTTQLTTLPTTQPTIAPAYLNFINDTKEISISRGNLAYIISQHENSWKLTFNVIIYNVDAASTTNILQLTSDDSSKSSLFIHVQALSLPVLTFCIVKENNISCFSTKPIELNTNIKVKVRNYFIDGQNTQVLMVSVNNMHQIYQEHMYDIDSSPAKLYVSSTQFDEAAGKISNLQYKSGLPLVEISRNNFIEQLDKNFGKTWYVDVLMKTPIIKDNTHYSVFHFTIDDDNARVGNRFPALFFLNELVLYRFDINNQFNGFHFDYDREGSANDLMYIRMEQVYTAGMYKVNCYFNAVNIQNRINNNPTEFANINVWFSDPWQNSPDPIQVYEFDYGSLPDPNS